MEKIEIFGLKITEDISPEIDLPELIVRAAKSQAGGIVDGDVVVITSKIVSKVEGQLHNLKNVKPSPKARRLSRIYKTPPEVMELYLRAGEIRAVIPIKKLADKYRHLFEKYVADREAAQKVINEHQYLFLIDVDGRLLTWGGIDFSNSPPGYCTSIPKDPDKSARRIRARIRELTGMDVAVIISDTEWKLDKFGTIDIALGSSGIMPVSRKFAGKDLYGKPKFGGVDDLTDLSAAAANLVIGQTDEALPIAIIRGLKYERSEQGVRDAAYPTNELRKVAILLAREYFKFKLLSKIA
ncbi:MAG: coenzyme F420-0:L-glutamate ligase [Nitrososphaerota archaeon]